MTVKTGATWSGLLVCKDATGALSTPSVGPVGALYVDGVVNAASVTVSGSNPYKWTVTLPSLTAGQIVSMYITATIATIPTASVVAEDVADTKHVSDLADYAGGAVASVTGNVGGKVLGGGASAFVATGVQAGLTAQETRNAMKLAPSAGSPADGSIDDHLDDLATALAAATSTLTVVSAVDGDVITIYQAVSFQGTITGLAIPAAWTKLYFTVKQDPSQADADAIIQIVETNPGAGTDGLLRLNGAAGTAANGSLTVDQAAGTVVIDVDDGTTDDLALATGLHWSLKALYSTSASILLARGTLNVRGQATAAVT